MHSHTRIRSRALSILLALALCMALVPVGSAGAIILTPQTWYVDAANGDNTNTGLSETDALFNIQAALNKGGPGDTVVLLPGTYDDNGEDWPVNILYPVTIASRDGADTTFVGDAGGHALFEVQAGPTVVEGLTFQNGYNMEGGAIRAWGSDLDVVDCTFTGNSAAFGGAIHFRGDSMTLGISPSIAGASLSIDGCTFAGNGTAAAGAPVPVSQEADSVAMCYEGGALWATDAVVTITGSIFEGNGAEYMAPAVMTRWANTTVDDSAFLGNQVTMWLNPGDNGTGQDAFDGRSVQDVSAQRYAIDSGALTTVYSYLGLSDSTFEGNMAFNGAGVAVLGSQFNVSDCSFADNNTFTGAFASSSLEADSAADAKAPGVQGVVETSVFERSVITGTYGGQAAMTLNASQPIQVRNSVFYGNGNTMVEGQVAPAIEEPVPGPEPMLAVIRTESPFQPPPGDLSAQSLPSPYVDNCTIADNLAEYGILSDGTAIARNTVVWNGPDAGSISGVLPIRCDLQVAPEVITPFVVTPQPPLDDWFTVEPDFVDPSSGDYHLLPFSALIDEGTALAAIVDDDFDGVARPKDGNEDGTAEWDVGAFEVDPWSDTRLGGEDRYATSVAVSQRHFPFGADTVVLATGHRFADALSGSGLAGVYEAPLLLTAPHELPAVIAAEIERLGASHVILLGGENAINTAVESELLTFDSITEVERIGGIDRYETSSMIADEIVAQLASGDGYDGLYFVARGDLFADALTASPVAWANKTPILLVLPDELPQATVDVVQAASGSTAIILGGEAAVSARVSGQVAALVETVERVSGSDRYDTSAAFSEWAVGAGLADWAAVGVATGEKFPDALAGAPGIGKHGGVMLLSPSQSMHASIEDVLQANGDSVTSLEVLGGEAAVSADVYDALMALVNAGG